MSNIFYTLDQIENVVDQILANTNSKFLCLYGELGAGKTTLVKAFLSKLGAGDSGSSPTFGLVSEYRDSKGGLLAYHLDCYRLESVEEALDFGIEEYLDADCWVFVEWPEKIDPLLPAQRTEIHLKQEGFNRRALRLAELTM